MEWIHWALSILLLIFIFTGQVVHLHQKQRLEQQRRKEQLEIAEIQTEMNAIQKELHHERDITELIQKYMAEGLLILDDSDKIQMANRTAVAQLHIPEENWNDKSIFILTENAEFLDALRQSKIKQQSKVHALLKIDGKYIRARINRVEMGGIFGTIVLLVDVTYNVKAEKMRQEFTANVSHELKTPLTTIKGFGEMFGSGMITQKNDVQKYGAMIERESERLLFLINDIIRLSEIEEHSDLLDTQVELRTSAQSALQILNPVIQRNQIQIQLEGSCLLLRSNESYIRELFVNLIDNAI